VASRALLPFSRNHRACGAWIRFIAISIRLAAYSLSLQAQGTQSEADVVRLLSGKGNQEESHAVDP
jgi:hypothetical protein